MGPEAEQQNSQRARDAQWLELWLLGIFLLGLVLVTTSMVRTPVPLARFRGVESH